MSGLFSLRAQRSGYHQEATMKCSGVSCQVFVGWKQHLGYPLCMTVARKGLDLAERQFNEDEASCLRPSENTLQNSNLLCAEKFHKEPRALLGKKQKFPTRLPEEAARAKGKWLLGSTSQSTGAHIKGSARSVAGTRSPARPSVPLRKPRSAIIMTSEDARLLIAPPVCRQEVFRAPAGSEREVVHKTAVATPSSRIWSAEVADLSRIALGITPGLNMER